jgi:Vitamin K-dependent gamma-carboxylase
MTQTLAPSTWNPFTLFVRFWRDPVRAEPLALFRILLAVNLFLNIIITVLPYSYRILPSDGIIPATVDDEWLKKTGRFSLLRGPLSFPVLSDYIPKNIHTAWAEWGAQPENAYLLLGIYLGALAMLAVGLFTRLSTVVCWALCLTFYRRLDWMMNGGDAVARMGLFYLIFAPSGAVWSLDALWRRARTGKEPSRMVPPWSLRLMQIQVCLVYLFTALNRLNDDFTSLYAEEWSNCHWLNGEAVYWALNDVSLTRFPYAWLPIPLWICRLLSWGSMFFELGFTFLVLFRWTRPWILIMGILFHLGIFFHMELAWFSQFSLCWYVLFVSGDSLRRFFHWAARVGVRSPKPAALAAPLPAEGSVNGQDHSGSEAREAVFG